jgi:dihydrofolate reductase
LWRKNQRADAVLPYKYKQNNWKNKDCELHSFQISNSTNQNTKMSKVILYIATSLDGFIARPDGSLDWLDALPNPDHSDHDYGKFISEIGVTIMGRATYDVVMGFSVEWPYQDIPSYVVSKNPNTQVSSPNTNLYIGEVSHLVAELKRTVDKDIWLIGGGQLITHFLSQDLVDSMILNMIPTIIGEGIPLFAPKPKESSWILKETKSFTTGVVNLTYERKM